MKRKLVNAFGALGYLFLILQWMWLTLMLVVPLVAHYELSDWLLPASDSRVAQPSQPVEPLPAPVQNVMFVAAIIFSISVMVYAIISLPRAIGRGGQRLTQNVAKKTIPALTHHKPISPPSERRLLERISWSIKALAVVIPLLLLMVPPGDMIELQHNVAAAFGFALAMGSIILFSLQLILSKLWQIDSRHVW